ncbi:hypothetical protein MN608_05149 [Microdochium nivale]|nr:hypothetical protein MN608_05149 [Microdochium nivale]
MADVVNGGGDDEHDHDQPLPLRPGEDEVSGVDVDVDVTVNDVDVGDMTQQAEQVEQQQQDHRQQGTPLKERHSLTLDQRRALRRWAHTQNTRPSHKACIEWFYSEYGQMISQSTISHSLSPKYARLDNDNQFSGSRLRFGNWPDVEKLVLLWHGQVVASGRQPTNEELAEKAKDIFIQLPRYKDETPPEFSPGWIHRFKKRYGLLIRRQRRHGTAPNPAEDIPYLVDAIPRFMTVEADTSPTAIRHQVLKVVGVEASLAICARARDEIIHRLEQQQQQQQHVEPAMIAIAPPPPSSLPPAAQSDMNSEPMSYMEADDPEVVLRNALQALQQEEADAEAEAAAIREERDRQDHHSTTANNDGGGGGFSTPISSHTRSASQQHRFTPGSGSAPPPPADQHQLQQLHASTNNASGLQLTPISNSAPVSNTDRPVRCPFCVNQRMLRTIKEAVEHLSTHVVV